MRITVGHHTGILGVVLFENVQSGGDMLEYWVLFFSSRTPHWNIGHSSFLKMYRIVEHVGILGVVIHYS